MTNPTIPQSAESTVQPLEIEVTEYEIVEPMTFNDLLFEDYPGKIIKEHASHDYPNEYGISVLHYYNGDYEVAIMFNRAVTFNTHIADELIYTKDTSMITDIMQEIEKLQPSR